MAQRLQLQSLLEGILGTQNVYFQPPPNISIEYPCIIYKRDFSNVIFSDNLVYRFRLRYQITLIDRNPDSLFFDKLSLLSLCKYDRSFVANNLNHDIFNVYF